MTITTTEHHNGLTLSSDQDWWTDKQLAALRQMGVDRAGNGDLAVFMHVCQRTGLDPFARQIYMIQRDGKQTIQTGIDGFRLVARRAVDRTGENLAISAPEWCGPDGRWTDVWLDSTAPAAARVTVTRGVGTFAAVALWSEYVQHTKQGEITRIWNTRPAGQLGKCAEALALRKACPQDLSGIYTEDEMARDQAPARPSAVAAALRDPDEPVEGEIVEDESPLLNVKGDLAKAMYAGINELGISDDERIPFIVSVIDRQIDSTKAMTDDEARQVLAHLDSLANEAWAE